MSDLIEMTDTVVDVHGFELRPGDEVESVFDVEGRTLKGKVLHITRPQGTLHQTQDGATTDKPPQVTVQFDNGRQISFEPEFLRLNMWRWNCMDIRRA